MCVIRSKEAEVRFWHKLISMPEAKEAKTERMHASSFVLIMREELRLRKQLNGPNTIDMTPFI